MNEEQEIGGFNFDDVVNAKLEELRLAEEKRMKDARDEKLNAERNRQSKKKGEKISEERRTRKGSTRYTIEEGSFDYQVIEESSEGVQQYHFLKAPLGRMQSSEFPKPLMYNEWKERAINNSKENKIVPASSKEIHILARAAYDNRNGKDKNVAREIVRFLATAMKDDEIGAYSRIVWQGKSACIMHSEGLPQEHWERLPNVVRTQSIISLAGTKGINENDITNKLFGDQSYIRVRKIYEWIEEELYPGKTTTPHIETCTKKFTAVIQTPETAVSYRLQEEYFATTTQLQPALTIELANKTIDEDTFCAIGVRRSKTTIHSKPLILKYY